MNNSAQPPSEHPSASPNQSPFQNPSASPNPSQDSSRNQRPSQHPSPSRGRPSSPRPGARALAVVLVAATASTAVLLGDRAPDTGHPTRGVTVAAAPGAPGAHPSDTPDPQNASDGPVVPATPPTPLTPATQEAPSTPETVNAPEAPHAAPAPHFEGKAFDTCEAPSLAVMKAWRASSPYRAVGIYFGGRGRGCPTQRELNPAWVSSVHTMGWRLLPLFVGSQAPCVYAEAKRPFAIGGQPWSQGTQEGGDAVRAARALGIGTGSPLYLDMEAYRLEDTRCAETTLSFVRAWNREVRRLGYLPGFYSSADTGVRHMERQRVAGTGDLPAVMWFARWRGTPALATEPVLHPQAWQPDARLHQYAGNVTETYGGRRMAIDRNAVDAPVAHVTPPAPAPNP